MRVLITAGNTHEAIDNVREWSNIFTGGTGLKIAQAISPIAHVDLLTSNAAHIAQLADPNISPTFFRTHAELKSLLAKKMGEHIYDAVFMTAAVSDYRPTRVFEVLQRKAASGEEVWRVRDVQAGKIKSTHRAIAVLGEPTEKLADLFRGEWKHRGLLVKFKLEVGVSREELVAIGQASRRSSGAEFLVANTLEMVAGQSPGAFLLGDDGAEWIARDALPARMRELLTTR